MLFSGASKIKLCYRLASCASLTPLLILLSTLLLVQCGGGAHVNPLWITIDEYYLRNQPIEINRFTYSLGGKAYCDNCPEGIYFGGTEICTADSLSSGVNVTWQNRSTGASGETAHGIWRVCNCGGFLGPVFCIAGYDYLWRADNVPLALGNNALEFRAYDGSGGSATASIMITRLASVMSTLPATNAIDVPVDSAISATFDGEFDPQSIVFRVSNQSGPVNGSLAVNGLAATFTPASPLPGQALLTAYLSASVRSQKSGWSTVYYSWTFTTGMTPDTSPPTVIFATPAAIDVPVNTAIVATFSEPMDELSINTASFFLNNGVTGITAYDGFNKATFTLASSLAYSTTYTATITTAVKDLAGNPMAAAYSWTFTTSAAPDTAPPTVSSVNPAEGATDVTLNSGISVRFNEPMMASTLNSSTFTLNNGMTGIVVSDGAAAKFTPANNLAPATTYMATITSGVKDVAGNPMATAYSWTFSTGAVNAYFKISDTGQTIKSTNIFGEDADYSINPASFTDYGNGTIKDNVTGLVWQKQDDATLRTWNEAEAYCGTLALAGLTGWRLPSRIELVSLIDRSVDLVYGGPPAINTMYFPGTSPAFYWSSAIPAGALSGGVVDFYGGSSYRQNDVSNYAYVRCVRGSNAIQHLIDNGDGTVTDRGTLLTWQQGEASPMAWETALPYCENLTLGQQTDWRLPTSKELFSIVDEGSTRPIDYTIWIKIDKSMFPSANGSNYWSSTVGVFPYVDTVHFGAGNIYTTSSTTPVSVRCVRGGW